MLCKKSNQTEAFVVTHVSIVPRVQLSDIPSTTISLALGFDTNGPQTSLLNRILGTPGSVASAIPANG